MTRDLYAPMRVPMKARAIARKALAVRTGLPRSKQAGTEAGLTTATALATSTDNPGTWYAIRRFWPRWAMRYRFLVARGETAATSKIVMAGDLWGGLPLLELVEAEEKVVMESRRLPPATAGSSSASDLVVVAAGKRRRSR